MHVLLGYPSILFYSTDLLSVVMLAMSFLFIATEQQPRLLSSLHKLEAQNSSVANTSPRCYQGKPAANSSGDQRSAADKPPSDPDTELENADTHCLRLWPGGQSRCHFNGHSFHFRSKCAGEVRGNRPSQKPTSLLPL